MAKTLYKLNYRTLPENEQITLLTSSVCAFLDIILVGTKEY